MASLVLTIKGVGVADMRVDETCDHEFVRGMINHLQSLASGNEKGTVHAQSGTADPVAASATLTLVSAIATDAITIGPVTFTATSTPTLSTHWEIDGADDTADAASLAAAINAHATASQVVTATSNLGVVTVTAKQRGVVGNYINISSADATITASAANLAGGTGGATNAAESYTFGE
jgi:phage tail sheath gpL-like